MADESLWKPGTAIIQADYWYGHPLSICPVTVVKDEPEALVLYTRAGTRNLSGHIPNRSQMPVSERTRIFSSREPTPLTEVQWRYHLLALKYPGKRYTVQVLWRPDWEFLAWFGNLEPPFRRTAQGIENGRDEEPGEYLLDIRVAEDLTWAWKDMDEFEDACKEGLLSPEQRALALEAAQEVIGRIERREPPFSEPWPLWRPDPAWPAPHATMGEDGRHRLWLEEKG